jgi:hypothetical protein
VNVGVDVGLLTVGVDVGLGLVGTGVGVSFTGVGLVGVDLIGVGVSLVAVPTGLVGVSFVLVGVSFVLVGVSFVLVGVSRGACTSERTMSFRVSECPTLPAASDALATKLIRLRSKSEALIGSGKMTPTSVSDGSTTPCSTPDIAPL